MSIEVYFIILILAFPMFFLCRRLLKNYINVKRLNIYSLLATIILTPLLYIGLIMIWIYSISYYPSNDFSKDEWWNNVEKRYELSEDIIESKMLIGKTKAEIKELLGEEGNVKDSDLWEYELGFKPALFGIDPDILRIEFKNDRVFQVNQYQG